MNTLLLGVSAVLACSACAGASSFSAVDPFSGQSVSLAPGPKKPGQSFTGRYRSPQSGELELVQYGDRLEGSYAYQLCGCHFAGHVSGEVTGNLAHVHFSEATACSPGHVLRGDGELVYRGIPLAPNPPELFGSRRYLTQPAGPRGSAQYQRSLWTAVAVDPRESPPSEEPHCP